MTILASEQFMPPVVGLPVDWDAKMAVRNDDDGRYLAD
jgi:hypothetical protein